MQRLLLALALLAALAASAPPAAAQSGPTLFRPELAPLAPPPFDPLLVAGLEPHTLAQSVVSCQQVLADTTVSLLSGSSPWKQLRGERFFSDSEFYSPSQSLFFVESGPGDSDSTGQGFTGIPANLAELAGALHFRYGPGSTAPGDLLRVEIYENENLSAGGLIARRELDVAALDNGAWQFFEWEVLDQPSLVRLRSLGNAVFVLTTVNANNGAAQQLWADDLTASLCVPGGSLSGEVRQGLAPAPGARVLLVRNDSAGAQVIASATTDDTGTYRFGAVPALPANTSYRVWFINSSEGAARNTDQLGFWAGPRVASLAAGADVTLPPLYVADTPLTTPEPHAAVLASDAQPVRLTWAGRGIDGERQQLCLYDPQRADPATGLPIQLCGPLVDTFRATPGFNLSPASFAAAPGFDFRYGRSYRWYVVTYDGDPQTNPNVEYGYSFFERAITLLPAPTATPPAPTPQLGDPTAGVASADWTLLVYVAADNALGDATRVPNVARPGTQLARLAALAAANPRINLVSYVDGYGDGGAQLCAYPPGAAPDCRQRAEPNSADPQTLASFIAQGRTRYPATHTALLMIAPGQAAGELALDESSISEPTLNLQGLEAAYRAAGLGGASRLDLVIYQAPNFGTLEALRSTAPYARFMVAASDQIWQLSALERLVPLLAGAGRGDPAAAARGAVGAYQATLDDFGGGRALSIAAYDLARVQVLAQRADELASAVITELLTNEATMRPLLQAVRRATLVYDSSGNGRHDQLATPTGALASEEDALVELGDLAVRLRNAVGVPATVHEAAAALLAQLDTAAASPVIASTQRSGRSLSEAPLTLGGARGMAAFFPSGDRLGGQPALAHSYLHGDATGLPRDGAWADMLRAYLLTTIGQGPGGVTEGVNGGAQHRPTSGGLIRTDLSLPMVGR